MTSPVDLMDVADKLFATARGSTDGRSSVSLHSGEAAVLRQTLVAVLAGRTMTMEHPPHEGSILVVAGRLTVDGGGETIEVAIDDLLILPAKTLVITAVEDTVLLLTVAMGSRP